MVAEPNSGPDDRPTVDEVPARTVVLLSSRLGPVVPASALPALRAAERILADDSVPAELVQAAGASARSSAVSKWPPGRVVLLTTDSAHPLVGTADLVLRSPEPAGAALLDAVAVMDRLRSPGGCPWDAEQTHTSLLQYLIEEAYELHQAVEDADRPALREELGDVLLQVLFHARLAAEGGVKPYSPEEEPFTIDEVAGDLVRKLVARHPHVFAADSNTDAARVRTAADQELRWDELKRVEKNRESCLDGVALGQPAVALAAKLVSRASKAGVPPELLRTGNNLFDLVSVAKQGGVDPEQELRAAARQFAERVRAAEEAARAAGLDPHALSREDWLWFWPSGG